MKISISLEYQPKFQLYNSFKTLVWCQEIQGEIP
jgi:hypothetical protein